MAQTLKLTNFSSINIVAQSQLILPVAAGDTTLKIANVDDFTTGYVLIGTPGSNTAEILPAGSASAGTSISLLSPTILPHSQYDAVYALFGNQLKIYRAPNVDGSQPADSVFQANLIATIAVDPNQATTVYTDATGGGGFWYKYTFFNQSSVSETLLASANAVRGSFTTNYCSIDEIREEAGFKYSTFIDDKTLDEHRQAAQDAINGSLDEFYQTPFQPPISDTIRRLTKRLAAGYARQAQYSQVSDPTKNGDSMVKGAMDTLKLLQTKQEVIVNKAGQNLAQAGGTGEAEGWPNETTATARGNDGGADRVFRMSDITGRQNTTNNDLPSANKYYGRRW